MNTHSALSPRATPGAALAFCLCLLVSGYSAEAVAQSVELSYGELSLNPTGSGTLEVRVKAYRAFSGFQLEVTGFNIDGASGGAASLWDFDLQGDGIVAHHPSGGYIVPGSYVLTVLDVSVAEANLQESCYENAVFSDPAGGSLTADHGDCYNLGASLRFGEVVQTGPTQGTVEVWVTNPVYPIQGFQFTIEGADVDGAGGGETASPGWSVSANSKGVVGTNLNGGSLPPGDHLLTIVSIEVEETVGTVCIDRPRISDTQGILQRVDNEACVNLGVTVTVGNVDLLASTFDIQVNSPFFPVAGFQLGLSGIEVLSLGGGETAAPGWSVSGNNAIIVGIEVSGGAIPSGEYTLVTVGYDLGATEVCLPNGRFSNPGGNPIFTILGDCTSLVEGVLPPANFYCTTDPPYTQPTPTGFLPGLFPGETIQLCAIEAEPGTLIRGVDVVLVSPEIQGGQISIVSQTYEPARPIVAPACGDGLLPSDWENGDPVCDNRTGEVSVSRGTPSGNYVLGYRVTVAVDTQTSTTAFDVPWIRLDLPLALGRMISGLDVYLQPNSVIPVDSGGDGYVETARLNSVNSLSLYEHALAAYDTEAMSTVFAAISDIHELVHDVRTRLMNSENNVHRPLHADELAQLLHELYRASSLESRTYIDDVLRVSVDSNVNTRFLLATSVMDSVKSEGSANPVLDIAWGFTRQMTLLDPVTRELEIDIASEVEGVPLFQAGNAYDQLRASANRLDSSIRDAGGVMHGAAEHAAVMDVLTQMDPLVAAIRAGGGSNFERVTIMLKLFELQTDLLDARHNAHLGNGDQLYWSLLITYVLVLEFLPNIEENFCGGSAHPWYRENAFRWDYLEEQLEFYEATLDDSYLNTFTTAALGDYGDWKLIHAPGAPVDPFLDTELAGTACGVRYGYTSAYTGEDYSEGDNCAYAAEVVPLDMCAPFQIDWYPTCGGVSREHIACSHID